MRVKIIAAALAIAAFSAPVHALHAQDAVTKAAKDVSKTFKKAGQDTKAEVHRDASKTHDALKTAGNDTKGDLKDATGMKPIGGSVGKAAKAVSGVSKKTGAKAKHGVKHVTSEAHGELTKSGKDTKEAVKKP